MEDVALPKTTPSLPWLRGSSSPPEPTDLLARVEAIGPHDVVYDWGCGMNHSPISSQVRKLRCRALVSVDAWEEYFATPGDFDADVRFVVLGDVRTVAGDRYVEGTRIDLSLCLDIVEHLEKGDAVNWLRTLKAISDAILVWIPLGFALIDHDTYGGQNHELHTHRSYWNREELEALNFACEVLENFHSPMFGWRVDGCWAVWRR